MASVRQLAANRANAEKSTGPRTEAGKRISRLNAVQHGLSGQTVLITPEQNSAFQTYSSRLMPDLAPANPVELTFAERIVFDSWRLTRAAVMEQNLFALADAAFDTGDTARDDALNDAQTWQLNDKAINLLSLYQQRLQRSIHKDLAMLRQMQKERRAEAAKPAAKPALQLIDKPAPLPDRSAQAATRANVVRDSDIGSVSPTPPADPAPLPVAASGDPSDMAA